MYLMMGIKNAVFFDNVRVPAKYLIGGENNGWKVASTHMELEHGGDGRMRPIRWSSAPSSTAAIPIGGKPMIEDSRVRDLSQT